MVSPLSCVSSQRIVGGQDARGVSNLGVCILGVTACAQVLLAVCS